MPLYRPATLAEMALSDCEVRTLAAGFLRLLMCAASQVGMLLAIQMKKNAQIFIDDIILYYVCLD